MDGNMKMIEELNKPLNPAAVKPAPAGKHGDYVDGYHVISEANRIFGNLGWSYEIRAMKDCGVWQVQGKNGQPQVRVSYACVVQVRVGDVVREGSAVGHGQRHPDNEGDAHESAVKEAETDALKRALRTLGNTFGLALYDKEKSNVKDPDASAKLRDQMLENLKKTPETVTSDQLRAHPRFKASFDQLDKPHQLEIEKALKDRDPFNFDENDGAADLGFDDLPDLS